MLASHPCPDLLAITAPVKTQLASVEAQMRALLEDPIADVMGPVAQQISAHVIDAGGKRLRPLLTLLSAGTLGFEFNQDVLRAAAILELIHTATLIHDDVIDHSLLRRGQPTANACFHNKSCILVGDYMMTRCFQALSAMRNHEANLLLSQTAQALTQGELIQMHWQGRLDLEESTYMTLIEKKTAVLFQACLLFPTLLQPENSPSQRATLERLGYHLGMVFQIVDDILDYQGHDEKIGKHLGDDLAEGKITLPLLYALEAHPPLRPKLQAALDNPEERAQALHWVIPLLQSTGALERAYQQAHVFYQKTLEDLELLPENSYRRSLEHLCAFALMRTL